MDRLLEELQGDRIDRVSVFQGISRFGETQDLSSSGLRIRNSDMLELRVEFHRGEICWLPCCHVLSRVRNANDPATRTIAFERHSNNEGIECCFSGKSSHEASSYVSESTAGSFYIVPHPGCAFLHLFRQQQYYWVMSRSQLPEFASLLVNIDVLSGPVLEEQTSHVQRKEALLHLRVPHS